MELLLVTLATLNWKRGFESLFWLWVLYFVVWTLKSTLANGLFPDEFVSYNYKHKYAWGKTLLNIILEKRAVNGFISSPLCIYRLWMTDSGFYLAWNSGVEQVGENITEVWKALARKTEGIPGTPSFRCGCLVCSIMKTAFPGRVVGSPLTFAKFLPATNLPWEGGGITDESKMQAVVVLR